MKRLVNIADVMREQNHRDRFCDFARIIFRDFAAQNINAKADHADDVPLGAPGFAVGIFLPVENRYVGVVKPMMRRRRRLRIRRRRIRAPEFAQLIVDLGMVRVMRKRFWIVDAVLVPGLYFVSDD